ncbi:MAG: cytochrome B6 [Candidatus Abyssobacteria bacterium SURF_5]|uniref:Cytochrome B6 n=1 Tax=Abyssobacteria bacterium (strain SURF_5) TaxID=2093360 RepID=A0A3A4NMK2_ABYX5|nr:MAG: cytochrome B6 [Candidatus Abyssubacteria bacterium SURF_5]
MSKVTETVCEHQVEMEKAPKMRRRSFLNYCVGATSLLFGGMSLYSVAKFLFPPGAFSAEAAGEAVTIPLVELPVGSAKNVRYKGIASIVIRTSEKNVHALSAVCTHLGCIVKWDSSKQVLVCPCHAAIFDINGNVVSGPAPRPLESFPVQFARDEIVIGEA